MAVQDLTVSLDLKQNLNIYTTCKQFDSLKLILSIYDNSVQTNLTNYNVRLVAMKSDNIPLIQEHIGITISTNPSNIVNIEADSQLTTTSGNTLIELQFNDKTTGKRKATFNLVLNVVPSTLAVNGSVSTATYTLLEELMNKLDQAGDYLQNIDQAIILNNELKTQNSNATGNISTLETQNSNAAQNVSILETQNNEAATNIPIIESLNTQSEVNIQAMKNFGDVSQLAQTVAEHSDELLEIKDDKTIYDYILQFKRKTYQAKGQMHCHTTTSDGKYSPTDLLTMYKNAGYDFVCITDHDKLNPNIDIDGIIHIRSSEYFSVGNGCHMCSYNVNTLRSDLNNTMYNVQDSINLVRKRGGLTSFAHPQMGGISLNADEALARQNYDMMEIFTAFDNSYYDSYIDNLLKVGKKFNLLAVDDFHNETANIFNGGWIIVNCDTKNQDSILKEIKDGNYYSSNGNDLNISLLNGVITASSTYNSDITFITNTNRITTTGTSATYNINGNELYVRIESKRVSDSKIAWSNPIYINKKENNSIPVNMVKIDVDSLTTLQPSVSYLREQLVFQTNATSGNSCSISNGIFTINSGTGGTTSGLLFSSYSAKYNGRTIKFSFDAERISGTGNIEGVLYYSDGDATDVGCNSNRVALSKSNLYLPIKNGSNIDNFIHYEISVTIPYNISSLMAQIRNTPIVSNTIFRVKNFKIEII